MQLDRDWATFKAHNMKPTASAEAVIISKRSFMAGAFCLLQIIESATGNASDEERIDFEAERLREWVKLEAQASKDRGTTIDPREWERGTPAQASNGPEALARARAMKSLIEIMEDPWFDPKFKLNRILERFGLYPQAKAADNVQA